MLESLLVNVAFRTMSLVGGTAKNRSYWGDRVETRPGSVQLNVTHNDHSMVPMKIKSIWNRIKR
jgi:hypothetical protein